MTRARDLSRLSNSNAFSVDATNRVGIGSTVPRADLDVAGRVLIGNDISIQSGIITATNFSGNIIGVAATFTGNVSIAGTLTYEDVTNIDSVGLITARSGVVLTGGNVTLGTGVTASGATSNTFTLSTNGSERLRVDSSGNINVDSGVLYVDAVNNRVGVGSSDTSLGQLQLSGANGVTLAVKNTTGTTGGTEFCQITLNNTSGSSANFESAKIKAISTNGGSNLAHLTFENSGTERLRITSAGLVGVGTSSPAQTLDVNGTVNFKPATGYNALFQQSGTALRINYLNDAGSANVSAAYRATSFEWQKGDGSPVVNIDSSGNVGIGTTSPGYLLDVASSVAQVGNSTDAFIQYKSTAGNWHVGANSSNAYVFYSGTYGSGTERARIDSSGRLLVGTSSESGNSLLTVRGNTGSATGAGVLDIGLGTTRPGSAGTPIGYIRFTSTSNTSSNYHYASIAAESDGTSSSDTDIPGRLVFSTTADGASSPTERMRIDNTGGILFGRTVLGNIGDSLGIAFGAGAGYAYFERSGGPGIYVRRATSTGNAVEFYQGTNTYVGSISVTASATAYNTSSDYRLKENVKLVTDGINRLQQLKPSRFNFIADPDTVVDGFIAHEVQAVVPEAITGEKDAVDEDGNPVYQGIDQSKLVPLLTAALQEAIGEIESLKARVATLETA